MQIEFDGRTWDFDEESITVPEAIAIQGYVGRNLGDFANGITTCEVKSVVALWWLLRKRAGENPGSKITYPEGFRPVALFGAYAKALTAELAAAQAELEAKQAAEAEQEEAEADPTRPAGSSPGSAATTTTPAPTGGGSSPPG